MCHNNSSTITRLRSRVVSAAMAFLLTTMMVPTASLQLAFAAEPEGGDPASETTEVIEPSQEGGSAFVDDSASDAAGEPIEPSSENQEADNAATEDEYTPEESFRFKDGKPISGNTEGYSLRSIGTNYPHTFVQYDEGNHTRSDALCGIDVSYWNGSKAGKPMIDWAKVKAAGIDYAIIRSSSSFTVDDTDFAYNVRGCIANNIPFGVYHYAMATNAEEANREADHVFRMLQQAGVTTSNITYPIYYDIENTADPNYQALGQGVVDTITRTFIGRMNSAGYKAGVYANTSFFSSNGPCGSSYINSLEYRWCAQYNSAGLRYNGFGTGGNALMNNGKGMWQFTSQGYVDGISGYVDLDYSYLGGRYEASGTASVTNIDKDGGTFRVNLSSIKSNRGIHRVEFAVWCNSSNGQDDLRWYGATRASDGSYYADVSIKDHKGYTGTYIIHAYVYARTGQSVGSDGSMATSVNFSVNPGQTVGPNVSANNFTVTTQLKGGEYARATSVRVSVTLSNSFNVLSSSTALTQGSTVWFDASKKGSAWDASVNVHHLRAAGSYTMDMWATVNGVESKVDQAVFVISSYSDPGVAMYRLYNRVTSEHFYTASAYERDTLVKGDWNYEGIGWIAASGGVPVYRLYNPSLGDHHYTTSAYERDSLVRNSGWNYEGVGWYTDGDVPLYRQYNPGLKVGQHHYTISKYEHDINVSRNGWRAEGIGWYALRAR